MQIDKNRITEVEDMRVTINNKSSRLANEFVESIYSPNLPKIESSKKNPSNDEYVDGEKECCVVVVSEINNPDLDEDSVGISKIGQKNQTILDIEDEEDDLPPKAAFCHVTPKYKYNYLKIPV